MTIGNIFRVILLSGFALTDDFLTGYICSKYGIECEKNLWRRKLMARYGIWRSIPLQSLISHIFYYAPIFTAYHARPDGDFYIRIWWFVMIFPAGTTIGNIIELWKAKSKEESTDCEE